MFTFLEIFRHFIFPDFFKINFIYRNDDAKSMWLDQAFREYLTGEIMRSKDINKCDKYIELSIQAAQRNLCSKIIPITLLSDMFDIITLDQCETLFATIERNIKLWKSEEFFTPIRNNLLRICNGAFTSHSVMMNTIEDPFSRL